MQPKTKIERGANDLSVRYPFIGSLVLQCFIDPFVLHFISLVVQQLYYVICCESISVMNFSIEFWSAAWLLMG